jgi:hypothetical protein
VETTTNMEWKTIDLTLSLSKEYSDAMDLLTKHEDGLKDLEHNSNYGNFVKFMAAISNKGNDNLINDEDYNNAKKYALLMM